MATAAQNKRVTATMRPGDLDNLEAVSDVTGQNQNEVLRSALSTERFVQENLAKGATMWFRQPDGTFQEVVFVR